MNTKAAFDLVDEIDGMARKMATEIKSAHDALADARIPPCDINGGKTDLASRIDALRLERDALMSANGITKTKSEIAELLEYTVTLAKERDAALALVESTADVLQDARRAKRAAP